MGFSIWAGPRRFGNLPRYRGRAYALGAIRRAKKREREAIAARERAHKLYVRMQALLKSSHPRAG